MSIRVALTLALLASLPACSAAQSHDHGHESHGGGADPAAASGATAMGGAIVETPHLKLTAMRTPNARDSARASEVLRDLREGIDEYRDYRKAIEDGYRIFLPNVPMKVYHFTNYRRAFWEGRSFDASKPSSLLYERRSDGGYTLVGAMYVAGKDATPDELHARVPLSMAQWHAHVNICVPSRRARARWRETVDGKMKFGPAGAISSKEDCERENARFIPQLFGWMVHVSLDEGFEEHHSPSHAH
ncbi:MAG: hypothetical protein ACT4PJ_11755 [Gemmatimonadaceae bacterium]